MSYYEKHSTYALECDCRSQNREWTDINKESREKTHVQLVCHTHDSGVASRGSPSPTPEALD